MEWKDIEKSKNVNVSKGNAGVDIFSLFFPFFLQNLLLFLIIFGFTYDTHNL